MTTATARPDAPVFGRIELLAGPQADFVMSAAPFPGLFGGRGSGKTVASVVKEFMGATTYPGSAGCITEPTYKQHFRVLLPVFRRLFGAGEGPIWEFKKADMEIRWVNGSSTYLGYAEDPESVRGLTLARFNLDEARVGKQHETFMNLQGCLRQEGFPHQGSVTTTPAGKRHWLYYRWVQKKLPWEEVNLPWEDYKFFLADSETNTHNPPEFLTRLRASFGGTRWAEQEIGGQFVVFEGQAFPNFNEDIHVRRPPPDMRWRRQVTGMDWGAIRPTAVYEVCQDHDNRVWVTREFYKSRCTETELLNALGEFPPRVYCDPSAKDVIESMNRHGVQARKAQSNDFALRVRLVGSRLALDPGSGQPGMYISPDCPNLIEEIAGLMYAKPRGMDEYYSDRWEPGSNDHGFDGVSYALQEIDTGMRGRPQPSVVFQRWGHGRR